MVTGDNLSGYPTGMPFQWQTSFICLPQQLFRRKFSFSRHCVVSSCNTIPRWVEHFKTTGNILNNKSPSPARTASTQCTLLCGFKLSWKKIEIIVMSDDFHFYLNGTVQCGVWLLFRRFRIIFLRGKRRCNFLHPELLTERIHTFFFRHINRNS